MDTCLQVQVKLVLIMQVFIVTAIRPSDVLELAEAVAAFNDHAVMLDPMVS